MKQIHYFLQFISVLTRRCRRDLKGKSLTIFGQNTMTVSLIFRFTIKSEIGK